MLSFEKGNEYSRVINTIYIPSNNIIKPFFDVLEKKVIKSLVTIIFSNNLHEDVGGISK